MKLKKIGHLKTFSSQQVRSYAVFSESILTNADSHCIYQWDQTTFDLIKVFVLKVHIDGLFTTHATLGQH